MEENNPRLKNTILQVVSNQLKMNKPPETKETLHRLISEGYSKQKAKELIGVIVSTNIYEMLKDQHEFDKTKYIKDLKRLPKLSWED
ncbi:MAG: hypothetical protein ACE5NG_08815 [bacterium]